MTKPSKARVHVMVDFAAIAVSIAVAVWLSKSGILSSILTRTDSSRLVGSFVAGLFFTSIFTTAPAVAALGQIALSNSIITTALLGALGAVIGDFLLYKFVHDRVAEDLHFLGTIGRSQRLAHIFHLRIFRSLVPLVGALIIASPLPDEVGLAMLGLSKMKTENFLILIFIMNVIGVVIIGSVARHFI